MESVAVLPVQADVEVVKRGRGRPRKIQVEGDVQEKRPRGRPRKEVVPAQSGEEEVRRGRGRPRKYSVLAKERGPNGEWKPVLKKVESGVLFKHMFEYFSKLLVLHGELSREAGKAETVFKRLQVLDFQMVEMCKTVLCSEYQRAEAVVENNVAA